MITVIASVVTSTTSLGYWLRKKFAIIDERFNRIDERFSRVDERINRLEKAFTQFSETLIMVLEYKGVFTSIEAASFRGLIKALLPSPS
ncbi:MAG: hypothetical protein LM586_04730 [Desulfurococcales archaeon]|jgi:hypothetical protein|nr:hypothetical protein [Desulfurococcales archaeon]